MSLDQVKTSGRGRLSFALVIEGWPHIFTTSSRLTLADSKGDREVIAGLKTDGLRFRERCLPGRGELDADAITFSFTPPRPASGSPTHCPG